MTLLVTGAAGFIGANTVRALLDAGASVIAIDRDPSVLRFADALIDMQRQGVQVNLISVAEQSFGALPTPKQPQGR